MSHIPDTEDFDEGVLSAQLRGSSTEYYRSFLKAKELATLLPPAAKKDQTPYQFYRFLEEVHRDRKSSHKSLFRKKTDANEALIIYWLSRAKASALARVLELKLPPFSGLTKEDLVAIAKLSSDTNNIAKLQSSLLQYGVLLVFEKSLPGLKLDGAVFMLGPIPTVALSLRYARLDIFWFTLLHELAHVHLHLSRLTDPILDNLDETSEDDIEIQANKLAADSFISRSDWRSCDALYNRQEKSLLRFADKVGIHPAIIAGRIQKELNRNDIFVRIINEVNVRKVIYGHD